MNDMESYIDFGDPSEKLSMSRTAEGRAMIEEVMDLARRSEALKEEALKTTAEILAFDKRISNKHVRTSTFEEQEFIISEIERLMKRLHDGVEKLKKLDDEYESIRKKVNKYCGKEVMKEHPRSAEIQEMFDDLLGDNGESWKG